MTDLNVSLAVIDPAVKDIVSTISAAVVVITPIVFTFLTLWLNSKINKKTAALDTEIKEVKIVSNGMKEALFNAGARASLAEGKEIGRKDQKLEDQATAMGREQSIRAPAASSDAANTAKVAEIISVVDTNVKAVDEKVKVIDKNVEEVHETVVKQTEIKTKT